MIWRARRIHAGRLVSVLLPLTRQIDGAGFIGERWPTTRATDGAKGGPNARDSNGTPHLPAEMHRAARWATATARDWRSGKASAATHAKNARPLNEQMALAAASTPTPNGSNATAAKSGVPNPEFPCWLQGFPAEYLCGEVLGIRSTPNSPRKPSRRSAKPTKDTAHE